MQETQNKGELRHKIFTVVGIVLCVILIPILIMNCILLVKGFVNEKEVPGIAGIFPMIVLTDSMADRFPSGSIIISKEIDPKDITTDTVITFFDPASKSGAVVTHKVERIIDDGDGTRSFVTKGTANNTEDRLPVSEEEVIGAYTGIHFKGLGNVAMFMQTTPGFIVCVFLPLAGLIAYDIIRRRIYEKQHADDKDELLKELEELRRLKEAAAAAAAAPTAAAAPAAAEVGVSSEEVGAVGDAAASSDKSGE